MLIEEYGLNPTIKDAQGDNIVHQLVACSNPNKCKDVMRLLQYIWKK